MELVSIGPSPLYCSVHLPPLPPPPWCRKYCPEVVTCDDAAHSSPSRRISMLAPTQKHKVVRRAISNDVTRDRQLDPSWLYPVLLPLLFPTLFAVYKENHVEEDRKLGGIVERLGTKTEEELARLFQIHR